MPGGLDEVSMIQGEAGNIGAEGAGIAQFITGLENSKKDKAALAALKTPFYKIQDEYQIDENITEANAGQGFSTDTKNFLTQKGQQGLGSSLSAILQGGGDPNEAAGLLESYQNSLRGIGAEDAEMHQKNIEYFQKANSDLAGQKTMQWAINEKQPYEAKLAELNKNVATDEQNKWGGLTSAIGSAIGAGTRGQNSALMKSLFAKQSNNMPAPITDPFTPAKLAPVGGSAGSPASQYPSIDPGSFSQSALAKPGMMNQSQFEAVGAQIDVDNSN